jgi:hypothetical protein
MNRDLHPLVKSDIHKSKVLSEDSFAPLNYDRTKTAASREIVSTTLPIAWSNFTWIARN